MVGNIQRLTTTEAPTKSGLDLGRTFSSFKVYNFRLYWCGQLVSQSGTWMQSVGQAWLVLQITHSALALATVAALQALPILCGTLFAGVVVDRLPKRRVLVATQILFLAQSSTLATLTVTGRIQLWEIYVLAVIMGCIGAFDNPARQAMAMELVGREHLVNAVGLNSAQFNGARLVGPAIAGFLIAAWGVPICFILNAISYLSALVSLLLLRSREFHAMPPRRRGNMLVEFGEGMRFLWRRPPLMVVVIVLGGLGTFGWNTGTVIPLLAEDSLHAGSTGYGILLGSLGAGCLLAGLGMAFHGRSSQRLLLTAGGLCIVLLLLVAYVPWFAVAMLLFVLLGAGMQAMMASGSSLLQLGAPDHLRGRVMSVYTLLMFGSTPIGALITGFLAQAIGINLTVAIEAGLCLVFYGLALLYLQATRGETERLKQMEAIPVRAGGEA